VVVGVVVEWLECVGTFEVDLESVQSAGAEEVGLFGVEKN
jgi:hypothetical protein